MSAAAISDRDGRADRDAVRNMVHKNTPVPECKCKRGPRSCRCFCPRCLSTNLRWESWGSYLDKDLVCQRCRYTVSIWDC